MKAVRIFLLSTHPIEVLQALEPRHRGLLNIRHRKVGVQGAVELKFLVPGVGHCHGGMQAVAIQGDGVLDLEGVRPAGGKGGWGEGCSWGGERRGDVRKDLAEKRRDGKLQVEGGGLPEGAGRGVTGFPLHCGPPCTTLMEHHNPPLGHMGRCLGSNAEVGGGHACVGGCGAGDPLYMPCCSVLRASLGRKEGQPLICTRGKQL